MKTLVSIFFVVVSFTSLWAQPVVKHPDLIIRNDNALIEATIVKTDSKLVYYYFFTSPDRGVKTLSWKEIKKITYADGREEVAPQGVKQAISPKQEKEVSTSEVKPIRHDTLQTKSTTSSEKEPHFSKGFSFSVGPEGGYMLGEKAWIQDEGEMGFRQGVGGSVMADYSLTHFLAVSASLGFHSWRVKKDYRGDNDLQYTAKSSLIQVPFLLGVKVYPVKRFYIVPQGGIQWCKFSFSDNEVIKEISTAGPEYGGRVGVEVSSGHLLLDISCSYRIIAVKNSNSSLAQSGNIVYAGLRLGVGLTKR